MSINTNNPQYYCDICDIQLKDNICYSRHIKRISHIKNINNSDTTKYCIVCDYRATKLSNFREHLKTKTHLNAENEYKSNNSEYRCHSCNFYTNSKPDYITHINTQKHKNNIPQCEPTTITTVEKPSNTEIYMELIRENAHFQKTMVEFCMKQNSDMQNTMIELYKNTTNAIQNSHHHNNNTNSNNTNTQNFNINIFLNETCKNAMNISDFIETLKIDSDSIEQLGRDGYVEGMTRLFVNGLNQIKVQERPIHCTDVKRETFYIRDSNEWFKDTDKQHIDRAISRVIRKNQASLHLWREQNPQWDTINTREYEFYMQIMQECIGGGQSKEYMNNRKLIRNLANITSLKTTFPKINVE